MYKFDAQSSSRRGVLTARPCRVQISVLSTSVSVASESIAEITRLSSWPFCLSTVITLLSNWTSEFIVVEIWWASAEAVFGRLVDGAFLSSLITRFLLTWFEERMTSFSSLTCSFSSRFRACLTFLWTVLTCFSSTACCLRNSRWTTSATRWTARFCTSVFFCWRFKSVSFFFYVFWNCFSFFVTSFSVW